MAGVSKIPFGKLKNGGHVRVIVVKDDAGLDKIGFEYLDGRVSRQQAAGELPVDENAEPFPWPDTPASRATSARVAGPDFFDATSLIYDDLVDACRLFMPR